MGQIELNAPSVNCFITKNKNRQKIYKNQGIDTVYLNDNDNFELEFSNMTKNIVMIKIYMNDNLISDSGIIIKPGQTNFLERFIEDNKKFIYNTYKVEKDNKQVDEAIVNNGSIRVEFYNEFFYNPTTTWSTYPSYVYYNHVINNPYVINCNGTGTSLTGTLTTSNTCSTFSNNYNTSTTNLNNDTIKTSLKETGIIGKGENSDQHFKNYNGTFEIIPFLTKEFKILPISEKMIEFKEIRNYCTGCSCRIRQENWKFCPKCGIKI